MEAFVKFGPGKVRHSVDQGFRSGSKRQGYRCAPIVSCRNKLLNIAIGNLRPFGHDGRSEDAHRFELGVGIAAPAADRANYIVRSAQLLREGGVNGDSIICSV